MRTDQYSITSYFTDSQNRLTASALCKFFQESARLNAMDLHFGFHDLMKKNVTWFLSRLFFEINSLPGVDEHLSIQTWPSGLDGIFALRDFQVSNGQGKIIARAKSYWAVVDLATKKPQRPSVLEDVIPVFDEMPVMEIKLKKLDFEINKAGSSFIEVRQSDIDIVQHVNNTRYVDWITDDVCKITGECPSIVEFEINYLLESSVGEKLEIVSEQIKGRPQGFHHFIYHSDGREVCRAASLWR